MTQLKGVAGVVGADMSSEGVARLEDIHCSCAVASGGIVGDLSGHSSEVQRLNL